MRTALALALAMLAAPAWANGLAVPIDMMEATPEGPVAAADATPAERAYGLAQRGDWTAAREAAEPLADAGNATMATLMARIYGEGLGVARDTATATAWLERAAEAGDATARHDLALMLLTGRGAPRDEARALDLLRALAGEGRPRAAYDLAQALLAPDRAEAERGEGEAALRTAADAGLPQALYALARFIDESGASGNGGADAKTNVEALTHLVAASRAGLPEAQLELGVWLLTGRAGTPDEEAARVWLERAARAGLVPAATRLATLEADMARKRDIAHEANMVERAARRGAPPPATLPGVRWETSRRADVARTRSD